MRDKYKRVRDGLDPRFSMSKFLLQHVAATYRAFLAGAGGCSGGN